MTVVGSHSAAELGTLSGRMGVEPLGVTPPTGGFLKQAKAEYAKLQ